jgi:hypothetical protein
MQGRVDDYYASFTTAVGRGRNLNVGTVRNVTARGALWVRAKQSSSVWPTRSLRLTRRSPRGQR